MPVPRATPTITAACRCCRRDGAESVLLEVRASNAAALHLYDSLGFERVGLRRRYYADGEDAVLMTLLLRQPQQG